MSLIPIDEVVHFDVITSDPTTGSATDADSAPTFDVFEENTDTPILDDQSMTKRTSLTGNYRGSFTASAANGFEAGKWYSVVVTAIVGSITGKTVAKHFRVAPAEGSAGVPTVRLESTTHTGAVVPTVSTLTGHTPQTGDSYAVVNSGTHGNAALKTLIDALPTAAAITTAVWAAGTRTLTSFGTLVSDIWASVADSAGVTTLLSRLTSQRATNLDNLDTAMSTRASQSSVDDLPTNAELTTALAAADDAVLSAISGLNDVSTAEVLAQVQSALTATVADSVPADGSRPSIAQGIYLLVQFLTEREVSGTTMTVNKPDGTTALLTFTLDSPTAPTSITRAS